MAGNVLSATLYGVDKIYKNSGYTTTIDDSFSSPASDPYGVVWDGTNLLSQDDGTELCYQHTGFSSATTATFSFGVGVNRGLTYDSTNVYATKDDVYYKYTGFSTTISSSFSSPSTTSESCTWDGTNFIATDVQTTYKFFKYSGFTTTIGETIAASTSTVGGLGWDGINLVSSDKNATGTIYHHTGFSTTISASFSSPSKYATGVADDSWSGPVVATPIEQEGFAFGDDDDTEAAHTLDTQDTNYTGVVGTKTLRTILESTSENPPGQAFKLKYQKDGSGGYVDVPLVNKTSGFKDGLSAFLTTWSGVHTAYSLNQTNANTGTDTAHDANSSSYSQADTDNFSNYGTDAKCLPDAEGDMDIYTTTDLCMMLYVPDDLTLDVNYGLFGNGGGTNCQSAWLSNVTGDGPTVCISHNIATGQDEDYHILSNGGGHWYCLGFQFEDNSDNIAIWENGVNVEESAKSYTLAYGSGNAEIGDSSGDSPTAWGAESPIDSTGIIIANMVVDNPNSTNTTPPGAGDTFYTDYFDEHDDSANNEVYISASANVAAGGEATTARLTAPTGKAGDFTTGRRWDDENGTDEIDIAEEFYTELEWILTTQSPAATDDYFEFRIYNEDTVLDTYTLTPKWTIGAVSAGSIKKLSGVAWANVKEVTGVAEASLKKVAGVAAN